jgi:predicted small lipoprotein YifL
VQNLVGVLALLSVAACGTQSAKETPTDDLAPVTAQAEDRRSNDLVIFTTDTPGKGAWGILKDGWHVDTVEVSTSNAYPLPVRLVSTKYPDVAIEVTALPEPAKDERVLADASGKEGVSLGVFFGGLERHATADGKNFVAFESYVGSQLWRLRFAASSDSMPPDQLEPILKAFVEMIRPGSPMNGLLR